MRNRFKLSYPTRTVTRGWSLSLGGGGALLAVLAALASIAQPHQAPCVAPRCDLFKLNAAYLAVLSAERHKVNAAAPTASFDKVLLVGTIRHNAKMQTLDSLFHDPDNAVAELVGTLLEDDPIDADKLARLVYSRLDASRMGHKEIQESPERTFISVAASKGYYTVRLARVPGGGVSQRPQPHQSR